MKKFKCTIDGELAEGCPIGDRESVYNWMVEKYGELEEGLMDAFGFFGERDRDNYFTADGRKLVLEEV